MSIYLKQIEQLVALQQIDSEILELHDELNAAPKEVESLQTEFDALDQKKSQLQEKIDYLKEQESRLATEIEDDSLKVKKSKNKLMMASNTKEYHAMMREMDNLEKLNRMREEEKLTLVDELDRLDGDNSTIEEEVSGLKADLDKKQANLKTRIKAAEERLAVLDKQRTAAGNDIPAPVLSRYEFIRSRLEAPVIVPVAEGVCSGCNICIPPQGFIELQKGKQILSCPNCQRLIYWCEHFQAEPLKTAPKEEAETA